MRIATLSGIFVALQIVASCSPAVSPSKNLEESTRVFVDEPPPPPESNPITPPVLFPSSGEDFRESRAFDVRLNDEFAPSFRRSLENELQRFRDFQTRFELPAESFSRARPSTWLQDRIRWFVPIDSAWENSKRPLATNVIFPEANVRDVFATPSANPENGVANGGQIILRNSGAALYLEQKQLKEVWRFSLSARGDAQPTEIPLLSPRVGVVKVARTLFSFERLVDAHHPQAISNSLARWMLWFHEARHSDGHGDSLAFEHSLCPEGHDYAGLMACDSRNRGANFAAAEMLKAAMAACGEDCPDGDREALKLLELDAWNRILPDAVTMPGEDESERVSPSIDEDSHDLQP